MRNRFRELSEDEIKQKIYDSELISRLFTYLKPYKLKVIVAACLLLFVAFAQTIVPIIQKRAIDNVIASKINLIKFSSKGALDDFSEKYEIDFTEYHSKNAYYLQFPDRKLNYIDNDELKKLKKAEKFKKHIILVKNSQENKQILKNLDYTVLSEDKIFIKSALLNEAIKSKTIKQKELNKLRQSDLDKLIYYVIAFLAAIILQFIFRYTQIYLVNYSSQHAMFDLRRKLFSHLSEMPLSFFDKNPVGRLVTRVTNDVRTLDEFLSNGLIELVQQSLVLVGIVIIMVLFNWKFALITFTILPFLVILFVFFIRKSRKIYRKVRQKLARINATLSEDLSGVKIIQLFNQYVNRKKKFYQRNLDYYNESINQLKLFAFFRPLINSSRRVAVAIILWYGGGQIIQNQISLGLFMAFLSYIDMFFQPINHLSEKFNILQSAMSGSERIFDLMDKDKEDYKQQFNQDNIKFKGDIEFKNVWLSYDDCEYVLKDISFKVKPGEKIALVGHTGSGKTSIINLLSGLYPFQKGKIMLDHKSIKKYSLENLRDNIGVVQQDVFLFSGTIRDNIVLNKKDISDERLTEIVKYVNVYKFIDSLNKKFEEPVMERGSTFSVGQRQLIAFARVLAYDPAIFILDEATSNIDTETELLIQDAIKKIMKERTSIIIAHRLSTIQHVDKIIVLHKGRIKEIGSHQELLHKRGLYYNLYRLQYE